MLAFQYIVVKHTWEIQITDHYFVIINACFSVYRCETHMADSDHRSLITVHYFFISVM